MMADPKPCPYCGHSLAQETKAPADPQRASRDKVRRMTRRISYVR